ncbi:NTF2-like protein [Lojkania enalia]|uniref:Nuclear transport factor 2 n=1 Tax=Lojkania enalia TaxID=147567 RepID=A0A9P4KHA0_9PLEO|nr:NTF2-like protein [Didymosphaeria enalia]
MAQEAPYVTIGRQFVEFYYQTFDTNRAGLGGLYRPTSMMSWEEKHHLGADAIVEKLTNLPFSKVQHDVTNATKDFQPIGEDTILVLITGALMVEGQERPMSFSQVFTLKQDAQNWYIYNEMFRFVYPAA